MELGDLRLGNWVKIDVGVGKVSSLMTIEYENLYIGEDIPISVDVEGYGAPRGCIVEEVEGIELTEEIILRCGFKKIIAPEGGYALYSFRKQDSHCFLSVYMKNNRCLVKGCDTIGEISYVHQLQNIYYLVNREELEVKL